MVLTFSVQEKDEHLIDKLDAIASASFRTRSGAILDAISQYLERHLVEIKIDQSPATIETE